VANDVRYLVKAPKKLIGMLGREVGGLGVGSGLVWLFADDCRFGLAAVWQCVWTL